MVGVRPRLDEREYGFATLHGRDHWPEGFVPLATFEEHDGTSIIAPTDQLEALGLDPVGDWALITLGFESRLDGIGLTAKVSSALAAARIPCNVVAAFHHDHLFVPWNRREKAMRILGEMEAP
jgi:hypothetical protein